MGRVRVHIICIALMALGYAGLRFVPTSPLALYVLMAVVGIGWAATVSLPFAIMSQQISGAKMGLYMGLFNLSVVLPQLVASLGVGRFISLAPDKSVTMLVCALCLLVSAMAWMFVSEDQEDDTAHKSI
jgi:MFS family permease